MMEIKESRVLDINSEVAGVATSELMENAGRGMAECLNKKFERSKILMVCGTGNNGGDGTVAARYLLQEGWNVTVALVRSRADVKSALLLQNLNKLPEGVHLIENAEPKISEDFPLIVDGMLGTGLEDPPRDPYSGWIEKM